MKLKMSLLLAALLAPTVSHAATLELIVNVLAVPVGAQESPSAKWSAIAKLPEFKWRDRTLQTRGGQGATIRSGQVALTSLGSTAVTWEGLPDAALAADVRTGSRVSPDQYLGMLKSQFSPAAKVRAVRGGCKDPVFAQSAVYEVALPGKQPAYLRVDTKASWNNGNTTIQVSSFDEGSRWAC